MPDNGEEKAFMEAKGFELIGLWWIGEKECFFLCGADCGIRDNRPKTCRDFNPGSELCNLAREYYAETTD